MFGDSANGLPWNEIMFNSRIYILLATLVMFCYGVWRLIKHLEGRSTRFLAIGYTVIAGIGFTLGFY